eukprot:scaffold115609_cov30-Tisochrysis_lutea.AAC.2
MPLLGAWRALAPARDAHVPWATSSRKQHCGCPAPGLQSASTSSPRVGAGSDEKAEALVPAELMSDSANDSTAFTNLRSLDTSPISAKCETSNGEAKRGTKGGSSEPDLKAATSSVGAFGKPPVAKKGWRRISAGRGRESGS